MLQDLLQARLVANTLAGSMLELYKHMVVKGHLQQTDLSLLEAWLADLSSAGLVLPTLSKTSTTPVTSQQQRSDGPARAWMNNVSSAEDRARVQYQAITQQSSNTHFTLHNTTFIFMQQWCMHMDKVLYININLADKFPLQPVAQLLFAVYRPFFRSIVFAGPTAGTQINLGVPATFFPCDAYYKGANPSRAPGFFAHACLAGFLASDHWQSIRLGDEVGLFYINDDLVFSPCMLSTLNASRLWYEGPYTIRLSDAQNWWWTSKFGQGNTTLKEATGQALQQAHGLMAERVRERLDGGDLVFGNLQADVFYVPARFHGLFIDFAQQLHAHYIMTEIAVPIIMGLLQDPDHGVDYISMWFAWSDEERTCTLESLGETLPLKHNMDCAAVSRCLHRNSTSPCQVAVLHPLKMSDKVAATHWLHWWQTQQC